TQTSQEQNKEHIPFRGRRHNEYPPGTRHLIFNCATPIDDGNINVAQLLYRNDTEEQCSAQELIAWDAAIIEEDRGILESTDPDAPIDLTRKVEAHMPSDRPGVIMRQRLLALLKQHGETQVTRAPVLCSRGGERGAARVGGAGRGSHERPPAVAAAAPPLGGDDDGGIPRLAA